MSLEDFLALRGIPSHRIRYFTEEKIDCQAICTLSDDQLKELIPAYGDRMAIKNFAKRNISTSKQSLIEKLKAKMEEKNERSTSNIPRIPKKNSKHTRIIEIGWLNMNKRENRYMQVRTKHGGGTRRVNVNKMDKCSEILELAKELFFPGGISTKGPITEFYVELVDYKSHSCDSNLSIQEMYELTALATLRFYMATVHKFTNDEEDDTFTSPTSTPTHTRVRRSDRLRSSPTTASTSTSTLTATEIVSNNELFSMPFYFENTDNENPEESRIDLNYNINTPSTDYEYSVIETDIAVYPSQENEIDRSYADSGDENKLILHRGKVFQECIDALKVHNYLVFKSVKIEMILPNGTSENADDIGGVLRDAISEFWSDFYEKCTTGTNYKIPFLRHDFGEAEWRAISKFIAKGWESEGYFPIKIAPAFMKHCFGEVAQVEEILENFLEYICESESTLLKQALKDFNEVDYDELLECVSNYDSKWVPTGDNFRKLLTDIAHKEIIQKPAFVTRCFAQELIKSSICNCDLSVIYKQLKPTVKNVLSKLQLLDTDLDSKRVNVYGFLKRFIKETDEKLRSAFVGFCTGSDLILKNIDVQFIESDGIARSPVAHTCSGLLELPASYENFVEFRSELNYLLNSQIWVMDMV